MADKDFLEYDDEEAIAYIRKQLSGELASKFSDDDLYFLLDCIYDYYERNGFLEESNDDETIEIDLDELTDFVFKAAKKENMAISREEAGAVVDAEIAYCDTIGVFED